MQFPAGRTGEQYDVSFCRPDNRYQFRIEFYIDKGDREGTAQVFNALMERRNEIEKLFGGPLEWEPLDDSQASRIASYYRDRDDVRVREREKWPELRQWAIERMGGLQKGASASPRRRSISPAIPDSSRGWGK